MCLSWFACVVVCGRCCLRLMVLLFVFAGVAVVVGCWCVCVLLLLFMEMCALCVFVGGVA